ncbi:MAG: GMC family oxidoreductase, partial [Bryobacteraceae bacterium]
SIYCLIEPVDNRSLRSRLGNRFWTTMQILSPQYPFDAVVVGSGATGGWAAKVLTEAGMRVAMLEAGAKITPRDFTEHQHAWQLPYLGRSPRMQRDRPIQSLCYACRENNYRWFASDVENPYTQEKPFHWIRMRVLGGRSLSWGRQSYRMGDLDFKAASHDGYGDDWPISYADLAPYYERVERYVGISGSSEGLSQLPDSVFLPPMPMTCGEERLKSAAKARFGRVVTIGRAAVLTRNHNGRAACHYCGPCEQGCVTNSYFSSPWTTVADAQKTGRLTLVTDAVASHVVMKDGKAAGVAWINRLSRQPRETRARLVVLCASTLESTRLLLNSGICNSSGVLGKYLMDHIYQGGATGEMPMLEAKPWAGPPRRPNGIYVPRFRNVTEKSTSGFIRGYGYQGGSSPNFNFNAPGFGAKYKEAVRKGSWSMSLGLWGECLARQENHVEIDPARVDAWGVPVLKIHAEWSDNEKKLWQDGREQAAAMIESAGARNVRLTGDHSIPGFCIHETGTARMGSDPRTSVLNQWCQSHDVPNLFVTDGAAWVSSGCGNPTLTMMALTLRASDYIVREYAKKMV